MTKPLPDAIHPDVLTPLLDSLRALVAARLKALPPGWRVMVRLDETELTVGHLRARWQVQPLGPGAIPPEGWDVFGPRAKPCNTQRGKA